MTLNQRVPLGVRGDTFDQGPQTLNTAVEEDEDGDGAEDDGEATTDEEDSMVKIEDGGFNAECGGLIDYLNGKERLFVSQVDIEVKKEVHTPS